MIQPSSLIVRSLFLFLGLSSLAVAHPNHAFKRQNGETNGELCGTQNALKSCSAGWCCGPDGVCGKGGYYCAAPDCQFQYGPACDANLVPSGPDTSKTPRLALGSLPYGAKIHNCKTKGKIALTFDDGPWYYTDKFLDVLKAAGVKVTFFITGANGSKGNIGDPSNPMYATVKRMVTDGHQVASHTWTHQDLNAIGHEYRLEQMRKNEVAIANVLGYFPTYMRPPYLECAAECETDMAAVSGLGYHIVDIDLDTFDWMGDYAQSKLNFVGPVSSTPATSGNFIALAHDTNELTVTDLFPYMLEQLTKYNYTTATVGECLEDPPENWYRDPVTGKAAGPARPASSSSSSSRPASSSTASRSSASSSSVASATATRASSISASSTAGSSSAHHASSSSSGSKASASSKPTHSSASSAPPTKPSGSAPPTKPSGSAPPTKPSGSTPPTKPSASNPPSKPSGPNPPSKPSGSTPPSKPSDTTPPPKHSDTTPPPKHSDTTPPPKHSDAPPPSKPSGVVSPNSKCGGEKGYVCGDGECCSQYGWCGKSAAYCGNGCDSLFGRCGIKGPDGKVKPSLPVREDGRCGGTTGAGCSAGECCSRYGWCGKGPAYCKAGCQPDFGRCK